MSDEYWTEMKRKTILQQRAKMETYHALVKRGLPAPPDLWNECAGNYDPSKFNEDGTWKDSE